MNKQKIGLNELLLGFRRKLIEKRSKKPLEHDLTFSQFETLWFIGLNGKKNMETIADFLKIKPPSATSMINKLEKKRLIKRIRDPKDRRVTYISLTTNTKKHLKTICKQKEIMLDQLVSKLSKKDKTDLHRIIKKIISD